jgi:hypothetical protein
MRSDDERNELDEKEDGDGDTGFRPGSGGPASVIHGGRGEDEADELGEEMLEAPDEED